MINKKVTTITEFVGQRQAIKKNQTITFLGVPIFRLKSFAITYPTSNGEMDKYLANKTNPPKETK